MNQVEQAFEDAYKADHRDPMVGEELSHFTRGWDAALERSENPAEALESARILAVAATLNRAGETPEDALRLATESVRSEHPVGSALTDEQAAHFAGLIYTASSGDLDATDDEARAIYKAAMSLAATPSRAPASVQDGLRDRLQQKCSDWGTYWRAPDAHGVELTKPQAIELLQDALGVEVEIKDNGCIVCDGTGKIGDQPCECATPKAAPAAVSDIHAMLHKTLCMHPEPCSECDRIAALSSPPSVGEPPSNCTCHPDDRPQQCQKKFAASECIATDSAKPAGEHSNAKAYTAFLKREFGPSLGQDLPNFTIGNVSRAFGAGWISALAAAPDSQGALKPPTQAEIDAALDQIAEVFSEPSDGASQGAPKPVALTDEAGIIGRARFVIRGKYGSDAVPVHVGLMCELIALAERATAKTAKFEKTYCSQCGGEFGPGNSGFSACSEHSDGAQAAGQDAPKPVAEVVQCYAPSGKRVALRTEFQHLPAGTKLYLRPSAGQEDAS